MGLPVTRLLALGTTASGVAIVGAMTGPVGGALAGVVSSVLTNFFASLAQPGVDPAGDSPESLIRNHDLRKLVGVAIRDVILLETSDPDRAKRLATGVLDLWMSESTAADTSLAPLNEQSAAQYFKSDEISFDKQTALDESAWRTFLTTLADSTQTELPDVLRDRLAKSLFEKLPQMLRAVAKKDFTGDTEAQGRGYASLQLVLMGKIVSGIDQLLQQQASPSDDVLKEIRAFNARVPDAIARHDARVKDPRERAVLIKVLEQINQLRPHLDKRLDELSRAVASEGIKTRTEVRGVDRKVVYVLGGIALLLVAGFAGWALTRADQKQTQTLVTKGTTQATEQFADIQSKLDATLARSEATILTAIAEIKKGAGPAAGEISPEVLAAATLLRERGSPEQKALAEIIASQLDLPRQSLLHAARFGITLAGIDWSSANMTRPIWPPPGAPPIEKTVFYERYLRRHPTPKSNEDFKWAGYQMNLGLAYFDLETGDKGKNLTKAITAYEAAVHFYTNLNISNFDTWAKAQYELGNAYRHLPVGDRVENLSKAVAAYESALRVYTRDKYQGGEWNETHDDLSTALADLADQPGQDRCGLLRRAIASCKASLTSYGIDDYDDDLNPAPEYIANRKRKLATYRNVYESERCDGQVPFDDIQPAE